jgi:hypothetical protein
MAKMIPHTAYETGSEGEDRIFESLQTSLPDTYTVFHSVRWIGSDRRRSQGEADFIVFHPQKGVLIIEVKAGIISVDNNRTWYQTNRNTGIKKEIFDPEKQADESKFKFIALLGTINCLVCHAVWFPSVSFPKNNLPPNYHPDMILDGESVLNPEKAIENVFNYWSKQLNRTTQLNKSQEESVIQKIAPTLNLLPSLKLDFDNREQRFVKLTNEQIRILDFLKLQQKAAISGSAGTGKTFIALEKARQLHQEGAKVVFLCFNRLLADFLKDNFSHYGFYISTFDSLARIYVGEQRDFKISQAKFLDYLVDRENDFEFTDVIIDEGQDFENDWLEYLDYRISNENCFYVFYDQQQCLYSDDLSNWLKNAPCRLTLTVNCRNTEAIAKTAYGSLGKTPNQPNLSGIDGEQPEIISVLEPKSLAKHIDTLVNKYIIETKTDQSNIAIITMASYMDSLLEQMSAFSKLNYADSKQKGKVCKTTARKFKGLEADLVIITDIDWNALTEVTYRKLFYTSCSRAKHNLYLVSQELDTIDTDFILKQIQSEDSKRKGKRRFLKLFNLKENEVIRH